MTVAPPRGFTARPANRDDVGALMALLNRHDLASVGRAETSEEDVLEDWRAPGMDLAADTVVVVAPDGALVGYAFVIGGHDGDGYVDPSCEGRGVGAFLVDWGIARAEAVAAARQAPGTIEQHCLAEQSGYHGLLTSRGYRHTRTLWRMVIEMREPPPPPEWPERLTVATFDPHRDAREVHALIYAAFADIGGQAIRTFAEWSAANLERETFDPSLWAVVRGPGGAVDAALVGMLRPGAGFVRQLGVRREARGRGLGLALLRWSFGAFYGWGQRVVGLAVDCGNATGAIALYERAGMRVESAFQRFERQVGMLRAAPEVVREVRS